MSYCIPVITGMEVKRRGVEEALRHLNVLFENTRFSYVIERRLFLWHFEITLGLIYYDYERKKIYI